MKIKIETADDRLSIENGKIKAIVNNNEYSFFVSEVEQVLIITTDLGPFYDDMCLAVRINEETAIFIMSEHPCYNEFLFDQLGKEIQLDYDSIIKASTCTENDIFVVYKRE